MYSSSEGTIHYFNGKCLKVTDRLWQPDAITTNRRIQWTPLWHISAVAGGYIRMYSVVVINWVSLHIVCVELERGGRVSVTVQRRVRSSHY